MPERGISPVQQQQQRGSSHALLRPSQTHSYKSKKMTSEALSAIMLNDPRSLPAIAADPFAQFRHDEKASPFDSLSPYALGSGISAQSSLRHLQNMSEEERRLHDRLITPSPPKGSGKGSHPRHRDKSATDAAPEPSDAGDHDASASSPPSSQGRPRDSDAPNELTLTYLKILQKSEDFNRRSILDTEFKNIKHLQKNWCKFGVIVANFTHLFDEVRGTEHKRRAELESEEEQTRAKVVKHAEVSYHAARRHEDIRPACPILARGKRVHLEPALANGLLAEFRWRGAIDAQLVILVFDENERLSGTASVTELVKGVGQSIAIRKFSEQGSAISIGGSVVSFQVILASLPVRAKRVVFCVVNRSSAMTLEKLARGWFTIRAPHEGESLSHVTKSTKEVFACAVREGGPYCGLAIASVVRRGQGATWTFGCDNEPFLLSGSAQKVAAQLSLNYTDPIVGLETEIQASYERLSVHFICGFWEEMFRRVIELQVDEALESLRTELRDAQVRDAANQEKARRRASMRFKSSATVGGGGGTGSGDKGDYSRKASLNTSSSGWTARNSIVAH